MIKKKSERKVTFEVDLTGPDGNAFVLMAMAKEWARGTDKDWKALRAEMMSGDYENLLAVLEREFSYVTFYR